MVFKSIGQKPPELPFILDDTFASNAFIINPSIENIKNKYGKIFTISKKPVRNEHIKGLTDTLYIFSSGKTNIKIYKTKHRQILLSAFIDNDKIHFKNNIKIGIEKEEAAKRLKHKITANKVQVGDLEQAQVYTLTFAKGKLASISYEGYID